MVVPLPKCPPPVRFLPKTLSRPQPMEALVAEVADLRFQLHQLKSARKSPCQGVTGKGTVCRNGALPGTSHCRMHSREPKPTKERRPRKEPRPRKIIPEHTHPIGHSDPQCALCESHGDCMDPTLPSHQFEGEIMCVPIVDVEP